MLQRSASTCVAPLAYQRPPLTRIIHEAADWAWSRALWSPSSGGRTSFGVRTATESSFVNNPGQLFRNRIDECVSGVGVEPDIDPGRDLVRDVHHIPPRR